MKPRCSASLEEYISWFPVVISYDICVKSTARVAFYVIFTLSARLQPKTRVDPACDLPSAPFQIPTIDHPQASAIRVHFLITRCHFIIVNRRTTASKVVVHYYRLVASSCVHTIAELPCKCTKSHSKAGINHGVYRSMVCAKTRLQWEHSHYSASESLTFRSL